jgi:aminomethyltransferase
MVGLEISWEELEQLYEEHSLPPHLPATAWRTAVPVYDGRRQIGRATSGTWSPLLKKNLALATVEARYAEPGTRIRIEHTAEYERRSVTATVVKRPFFDPERKRT